MNDLHTKMITNLSEVWLLNAAGVRVAVQGGLEWASCQEEKCYDSIRQMSI